MKKLFSMLALAVLAAGLTFATGTTEESAAPDAAAAEDFARDAMGMPLSAEPITLDMVRLSWPGIRGPASETWTWKRFAELSNITVNFEEWPISGFAETLQVRLAAEQLPDAFYQMIFNQDQLVSQSLAGNLIALDDLIAEHGPNIQAALAADASIAQALVMPDGKIHSLPFVAYEKNSAMVRFYVNQTFLNNLGLEAPATIDDLSAVLAAFKSDDANGNGDPDDEFPIHQSGNATTIQRQAFYGAYGLGNRGLPGLGAHVDQGPDGKVRFIPVDERYREMLTQFNEWWEAGYYHTEFFSGVDVARWQADAADNRIGLFTWVTPGYVGVEPQKHFTGVSQFVGPHGDHVISWVDHNVRGNWSFMITSENEYPVETMRWVDYWYGEPGYLFSAVGLEGETFQLGADGAYQFIGEVAASIEEEGLQVGAFQHLERWYGGFEPQVNGMELSAEGQKIIDDLTASTPDAEIYRMDPTDYLNHMPDAIWPNFMPTAAEAAELGALLTDINTYVAEMTTKFITGDADLGTEWDDYVNTLQSMGYERYVEIKQAQHDRIIGM